MPSQNCLNASQPNHWRLALSALRWRMPTQCLLCDQWCRDVLCPPCLQQQRPLTERCPRCALAGGSFVCQGCQQHPPPWQQCMAGVSYTPAWRRLILDCKFHGNPALCAYFSSVLQQQPALCALIHASDFLLPVPLAAGRLKERGFNPSLLMAQALCPTKCAPNALWRLRETAPQSGLNRSQRQTNLTHAFALNPSWAKQLKEKTLVLVDDVMTTGQTLMACAQALQLASPQAIHAVVFARAQSWAPTTPPPHVQPCPLPT